MPTINIDIIDLFNLLRTSINEEQLKELLEYTKCEIKEIKGTTVTLEVNADRPDLFSTEGLARALRPLIGKKNKPINTSQSDYKIHVEPQVLRVRPAISAFIVRNVKLNETALAQIFQFQEKIHETVCRNRKKGSIGLYDISHVSKIIKYTALPLKEIKFRPLDYQTIMNGEEILKNTEKGIKYGALITEIAPLLIDEKGIVLSMPPIINSEDTRVTTSTKDVLIDVTGFDREFTTTIARIIAYNLAERNASHIESVKIEYPDMIYIPSLEHQQIRITRDLVNRTLGLRLRVTSIAKLLRKMNHIVEVEKNEIIVKVPPYRIDILHPIDLVEDVAIAYGYMKLNPTYPLINTKGQELPIRKLEKDIREIMIGFGYQEILTYMMTSPKIQIENMLLSATEIANMIEVENPVSDEYTALRTWLIPNILNFLSYNIDTQYPQKVFEIGYTIKRDPQSSNLTTQEMKIAAAHAEYSVSYEQIQAIAYALIKIFKLNPQFQPLQHPSFLNGRAATIKIDNIEIGIIGEIHPKVLLNFRLRMPTAAFEINITKLAKILKIPTTTL
ncbi:MAG: phenylalanine--tRNA ligase subunit beta [Thermoprotei archaeon]